jgi:F420-dependent oxidoreductase-like protein
MRPTFGVHIGQQNLEARDLRALWRRLDEAGVDWISVWDHLYEAPPAGGTLAHFETLTTLGALAADTRRARLGCLVFYPGYRNPALLARAATTLDHLSGGRFVMGLGAGWHEEEARAHGYAFPGLRDRLDMLEESVRLIRGMLTQPRTTFEGRHFRTENASCLPAPLQRRLPLWIGGTGRKRTLRIAARHADGWNAAYVGPEEYARLNRALDDWCAREGRDPQSIERSVNLSFALAADRARAARAEDELRARWGEAAVPRLREGSLMGTPDQAAKRVTEYLEAGARNVNVALRAPWDAEALDAYVSEVIPALRRAASRA